MGGSSAIDGPGISPTYCEDALQPPSPNASTVNNASTTGGIITWEPGRSFKA